jgi:hypothetical protein
MSNDRERLERYILQLTGLDIDGLVSRPGDWGPINFEEGRKDLEAIRELAGVMGGVVIDKIPGFVVPQLTRAFESAANAVAQISSYNCKAVAIQRRSATRVSET